MKKFLLFILILSSTSIAQAYELDFSQKSDNTLSVHARLAINKEQKRLELYFRDRLIIANINIKKSTIRWALEASNSPVSTITLRAKRRSDNTTGLDIVAISSGSGELDTFKATSEFIRKFQKQQPIVNLYDSFLKTHDMPDSFTIPNLPFYAQAPLENKENWRINEESCEEAALLLNYYITNGISFNPEKMNTDILDMNNFQVRNGIAEDKYSQRYNKYFLRDLTDPYEMYDLLGKKYLNYADENILMVRNPTIENIQQFVANKSVLTVPMKYTKDLRNKYIRTGKTFHILDIVGYTPDTFITLDPGTKNGKYLSYPKKELFQSIQENGNYFIVLKKK